MKLLAFAASSSKQSINKKLLSYATRLVAEFKTELEVEIVDLNDFEMPIFSIDREKETGIPALAQAFFDKIAQADAVIISFAEHNGSYTAAYKNIFDWASRIDTKVYQGKAMVFLATSPGPGGASNVLAAAKASAPYFGAELKASLSIPAFFDNFDLSTGTLSNAELNAELSSVLHSLV